MRQQPNSNNNTARCVTLRSHTCAFHEFWWGWKKKKKKKKCRLVEDIDPFSIQQQQTHANTFHPRLTEENAPGNRSRQRSFKSPLRLSLSLRSLCLVEGHRTTIRSSFDEFLTDEGHTQTNSRAWNFGQNHRRRRTFLIEITHKKMM